MEGYCLYGPQGPYFYKTNSVQVLRWPEDRKKIQKCSYSRIMSFSVWRWRDEGLRLPLFGKLCLQRIQQHGPGEKWFNGGPHQSAWTVSICHFRCKTGCPWSHQKLCHRSPIQESCHRTGLDWSDCQTSSGKVYLPGDALVVTFVKQYNLSAKLQQIRTYFFHNAKP